MSRFCLLLALTVVCGVARASWYWPFGSSDDDRERPRISELMEPASLLIDEAADFAEAGKVDEAVASYRKALEVLDRIEYENPDRAGTADFSTVNNKRAYVDAAIDSLLLKQAQQNAKAVAVTDTTELEKKYARLKGKPLPEEKAETDGVTRQDAASPSKAPQGLETRRLAASTSPTTVAAAPVSPTAAAPVSPAAASTPARKEAENMLALDPKSRKARLMLALEDLRAKDYASAELTLAELLDEKPNDAAALNMRAAVETERGEYKAAERTLDQSIRSNPRSHYAYYNMARLFIRTRGAAGKASARRYYETGRTFGGPADAELEGLLK